MAICVSIWKGQFQPEVVGWINLLDRNPGGHVMIAPKPTLEKRVPLVMLEHAGRVANMLEGEKERLEREVADLRADNARLVAGLRFYADKSHFSISDDMAWDTVSGEPQNFWCDEAGTAMVEDGSVARAALGEVPPLENSNG